MTKLDELKEAVNADRFDGRIDAIKKAFKAYKKSLELSRWERMRLWVREMLIGE